MAFVVPQHLPRATFGQGSSYGSSTSHSEPILRKLAEVTRESLTSTEASKWVKEIQKDIQDTKAHVHKCIHKDLPTFERQLASAKQIRDGLGLLPSVLTTLSAHSTLAQDAQDANILHAALIHLTQCRDEFKALSTLVEGGHLPTAVRKSEEAQSLIQSAPKPLERSAIMKDLSRMARVLGDRVQEQLGDTYSRAVAVTLFPTGVTVVILPRVTIRDSNNSVTLSELFTSLQASSLQEHLSTLRKDVLTRVLEPILTKPSRLVVSTQKATLPDRPSTLEVEVALFNTGLRSGDVREWAQAAPLHYERLRREDLVQRARSTVLEHDGTAVVVTRLIAKEEEGKETIQDETGDDPWASEEPTSTATPSVPIIATPAPGSQLQSVAVPESASAPPPALAGYTVGEPPKPASPPPEDAEEDGWGFDDEALETTEPQKSPENIPAPDSARGDTSEDEPDVEVYAGTSQSEAETSEKSEKSGVASHPTELISAPQSDAEVVISTPQSSEESDPWDDDPWAEPAEESKKESEPVSIPPTRGLQRFAQKNRGSGASSPAVSNSSPSASFAPSSAFGTAPSSAFPTSAISHPSPSKSNQPIVGSSSSAPFSPPDPPKIAAPITPAMRRAQHQAKGSTGAGPGLSASPLASPTKKWNALPQDDRASSVGSVSGLFGPDSHRRRYAGSEVGSQVGSVVGSQVGTFANLEQTAAVPVPGAKQEPATETYMVSTKAQKILALAEEALKEGKELVFSK
ncbi:hypothetical protein RSAG8_11909, partial [Rhizoctonia solani AG-8 WAC10335]